MRIIAGKYKKTTLFTLEGDDITRPTKDMVREALFSSININSETCFLDLFSGTGAIGIEAISRGAKDVIFNDINKKAVGIIRKNLDKLNEKRIVYNLDYADCLKQILTYRFDYIFCDPPYNFDEYERLLLKISEYNLLSENGIIIIEVRKNTDLNEEYADFFSYKEKRYGISKLLYFKRKKNDL